MKILNYEFEGPFYRTGNTENRSGVYAVLDGRMNLLDVGESHEIKNRLENHERYKCWERHATTPDMWYAVHYCDENTRMKMEKDIREKLTPPCGDK